MKRRKSSFNAKRKIVETPDLELLTRLLHRAQYGGNPEHKRNPGDFGLTPPASPRADKTLCDLADVLERRGALRLLRSGVCRGLVSVQQKGEWPQNVWAMTDGGFPMEAQLENREAVTYHGYPLAENDPFAEVVREMWERSRVLLEHECAD